MTYWHSIFRLNSVLCAAAKQQRLGLFILKCTAHDESCMSCHKVIYTALVDDKI